MTVKELFEYPSDGTISAWEMDSFDAVVKHGFSLNYKSVVPSLTPAQARFQDIIIPFAPGETVIMCRFGRTEYSSRDFWTVRFIKSGFHFEILAVDFFKLFDA